jgi:putative oxidoreductase
VELTATDLGLLVVRVGIGVVFSMHGFQKLFGWFGGGGFAGTSRWFASLGLGDGRVAALLAGGSEIVGGLGLAFGLLTPLAAAAMVGTMTVAAFVNHEAKGFWSAGNGWELNYHLIVAASAVAIAGPGAASVDAVLGIEDVGGPLLRALVVLVAIGLGWLRWATRSRPPSEDGAGASRT